MATDSSSGTLPSSSRLTIVSSSSIARSKESFLTSSWVFSAILRSRMRSLQLEHDLRANAIAFVARENRFPLFRIMLVPAQNQANFCGRIVAGVFLPLEVVRVGVTDVF